MDVPVIHTERLTLRGHRLDDFDALAAIWGDPVVARFIGGTPSTRDESWGRLLRYAGHWALLGYGFWAVEMHEGGRYVGDVGFANWQRDITPSLDGLPEGGWVFSPEAHGRGIATEALGAALGWMDSHAIAPATTCIINWDNAASIRVAEKTGYREVARSVFRDSDVIQFRR